MLLTSSIGDLLRTLRQEKARTITTLLGLGWGTFSIVALLALGLGLEEFMADKETNLGRDIVVVWPKKTTLSHEGMGPGRQILVRPDQVRALKSQIPELDLVSPEHDARDRLQVGERIYRVALSGVDPAYARLRTWRIEPGGRFLNSRDLEERRRVVVLGDRVKQQLFGEASAVGRQVNLGGLPFLVVGVLVPKLQDSSYSGLDRDRACLPASTHQQIFNTPYVANFVYRARRSEWLPHVTDRVYEILGRDCGFAARDRDALQIWDITEEKRIRDYIFIGFDLMLGGAAALTLLVGGVGVGNLMFIRVKRRSREIGILMALGARPKDILGQVFLETSVLVLTGGLLGVGAAWLLLTVVGWSPLVEHVGTPRISAFIGALTVVLLGAIGLLAGYFPARRAAHLDPVRALTE